MSYVRTAVVRRCVLTMPCIAPRAPAGTIPMSLVPRKDWVLKRHAIRPVGPDDPNTFFDKSAREWITMVFPSLNPSGRQSVTQLEKWLAKQNIDSHVAAIAESAAEARRHMSNPEDTLAIAEYMVSSHEGSLAVLQKVALPLEGTSMLCHTDTWVPFQAQQVYAIAFHEIVRQVSTHCVERGVLLARCVHALSHSH